MVRSSEPRGEADSATIQPVSAESPNSSAAVAVDSGEIQTGERFQLLETVSLALAQNPDLVALRQTERVGAATYGVASTYPFNPFVQVQATPYQDIPGAGSGTTSHYVLLMQRIQLAHQQQHREDAALSSLNSIRWNVHQAELQAASLTAQLYFTVLYQRGLLEVAQASQSNNQQLLEAINKRFEGGDASAATSPPCASTHARPSSSCDWRKQTTRRRCAICVGISAFLSTPRRSTRGTSGRFNGNCQHRHPTAPNGRVAPISPQALTKRGSRPGQHLDRTFLQLTPTSTSRGPTGNWHRPTESLMSKRAILCPRRRGEPSWVSVLK